MRTCTSLIVVSLSGLLISCGSGEAGDSGIESLSGSSDTAPANTTGIDTDSPASTSTSGDPSTSGPQLTTTGESGEDDGDPPIFDLGATPDLGELDEGCDAVDFLFVIDNSGSMGTAQDNLVANFPAFIDGIQNTLTDVQSYHVGVVTTDAHDGLAPGNPPECQQLGALVTQTAGTNSSNATCGPYAEGHNFITEADDLASSFACAAQVGTDGHVFELPMNAMEAAIGEGLGAADACNEGFIRDDALLVVVIISDEADGPGDLETVSSTGSPDSWYASVLSAKDDIPENAAALVLTNYPGGPCPPVDEFSDGSNFVEFANLFGDNGFAAGICEPDYGPSFADATAIIEQACENFVPPG